MFFTHLSLFGWLVPLMALPVLIHLLNRKFPRTFRFPSIEYIRKTVAQRSRLFRWRHWILALLRTLALALLLTAFLKPVREMFGSHQGKTGPRTAVILFDYSLSMEHSGDGVTARQRGLVEAEKIIDQLGPDDLVQVIAVGRNPETSFPDPLPDHAAALSFLQGLAPGLGSADFNRANALATQALAKGGARQEVYYISDFQRTDWGGVTFDMLPSGARLFFVQASGQTRENRAILSALRQPGDRAVAVRVGNFSAAPCETSVEVIIDGQHSIRSNLSAAPWSEAVVTVPLPSAEPGWHTIEARLPGDALPQDDRRFIAWHVAEREEVLVVSDDTGGKIQQAGFFLTRALNPFPQKGGAILPRTIPSVSLGGPSLAATRKVFLSRVDRLAEAQVQALTRFLNGGGSVVWFLDGTADAANLAALDTALGGRAVPLQLSIRQMPENLSGGSQKVARGDFRSKYLRLFTGTRRADLALLEFYEFYQATPSEHGRVLLHYADDTPALAVGTAGTGTLLLCNFSVNELSSNVARQRLFPAWIQDLVKCLDPGESGDRPLEIGDRIETDVWAAQVAESPVLSPAGKTVRTERDIEGDHYRIGFTGTEQGLYRVNEGGTALAFAVNVPESQADLRPVDLTTLPQRTGENQDRAHFVSGSEEFRQLHAGQPVFHWFLLGALAFLVLELLAQYLFQRPAR